jgi:bifunctional DNase/RNase
MMNEERPFNSTEFYIYGIIPYDRINGNYSLILKDNEDLGKMVAIVIGSPEAQSIAIFLDFIIERSINVVYVSIDDSIDSTFFATIAFSDGSSMDCRPSDAISIAIRLGSPIFVRNDIVEELSFGVPAIETNDVKQKDDASPKKKKPIKNRKKSKEELVKLLNDAIEQENYELAANLRDEIRSLKK